MQERRNFIANTLELHLSCTNPSICDDENTIFRHWLCVSLTLFTFYWSIPDSKVHGANMGPTGPRWAPCWPHELCYLGWLHNQLLTTLQMHNMSWELWCRHMDSDIHSHEWKSLANRIMSDPKNCYSWHRMYYFISYMLFYCPEHTIPLKAIINRSCHQGGLFWFSIVTSPQ